MEITQIRELGIGTEYYSLAGSQPVESIIFNEAMTGTLAAFYEYSTYEITLKDGKVIIVPSKDFAAVYKSIKK